MRLLYSLFLIPFVFLFSSCATVIKGTTQSLTFDSEPENAAVFIDGKRMGTTPFTMEARKNKYSSVRFEKEGYETVTRDIAKVYDPIAIGSVFWDFSTTDALSGAMFEYAPNHFFIELTKK